MYLYKNGLYTFIYILYFIYSFYFYPKYLLLF